MRKRIHHIYNRSKNSQRKEDYCHAQSFLRKGLVKCMVGISIFSTALPASAQNYRTGVRIGWNYRMQKFETPGGYGRVKLLKDGRQALVYDLGGTCQIRFKQPRAHNFSSPITVATPPAGAGNTNAELLELEDGTLIYAWNERWNTKVKVKYSFDGGTTWQFEQTVYEQKWEGDGPFGIWEPAMIQLPDGEVQIYFADESGVPGNDQCITMIRSTGTYANGARQWQLTSPVRVCYTVGARDGMPVPLVLQNDRGIVLAIEDDGWGGGFQPGILYTSLEDNWTSGTRYGDSPDRWIATIGGEPRGGGAPYLIQLNTGETLLSTQTNSLADTRNAPWDDMYKFRQFVYVGNAMARNFQCYSIPFPFMDEPNQGGVWNSLCQINDSTVMAVSEVHGTTGKDGIWTNEGRIMRPLKSFKVEDHQLDWNTGSETFVGSQSQANMTVTSLWDNDSLYVHFVVLDDDLQSPAENAVIWDADAVELFYDPKMSTTNNIPAGAYKFLVNINGQTLVSRSTGSGWQDLEPETHGMASNVTRCADGYVVDMRLPWRRIGRKPSSNRFTGYVQLHNKDVRGGRAYIYHEPLSGTDPGRTETWWNTTLENSPATSINGTNTSETQIIIEGSSDIGKSINVRLPDSMSGDELVTLHDTTGRVLQRVHALNHVATFPSLSNAGVLIISVQSHQRISKKVIVK